MLTVHTCFHVPVIIKIHKKGSGVSTYSYGSGFQSTLLPLQFECERVKTHENKKMNKQ